MKICGSITDALAGDNKSASAPSAAAPVRTEIGLGFGMFSTSLQPELVRPANMTRISRNCANLNEALIIMVKSTVVAKTVPATVKKSDDRTVCSRPQRQRVS
jgi:hypothetical protein